MKKFLVLLMVFALCVVLASCSGNDNPPVDTSNADTTATPDTDETPKVSSLPEGIVPEDFYFFKQFELPSDFRQAAVDHMRKQSSIIWTPSKTFGYDHQFGDWHFTLTYEAGKTYTGLPYASWHSTVEEFQKTVKNSRNKYDADAVKASREGTKYGVMEYFDVMGVQCNSSIAHSFQQFSPKYAVQSRSFMPGTVWFIAETCGNYEYPEVETNVAKTEDIFKMNDLQTMYKAMAQLQKGDFIMTKDEARQLSHLRMIIDCKVTMKGDEVNPNKSYVTTIEQTDSFDADRKDGVRTTWWVDKKYTFAQLATTYYIPLTIEEYKTGVSEIPYIALNKEFDEKALSEGVLTGTISSNYSIYNCYIDLYDASGKLVNRQRYKDFYGTQTQADGAKEPNIKPNKISLRKYTYSLFNEDIKAGKYTLIITAGILPGEAQLCRVTFDYKG